MLFQAKELLQSFPLFLMMTVSFFKSPWVEIRSHAALMTGLLYIYLDAESKNEIAFDTVCQRLLSLLSDEQPQVRANAAQAAAHLFQS